VTVSATPALEAVGLEKHFGGIVAAAGVNLTLPQGARHALIGPNGAGKTTIVNLLSGVLSASGGEIRLGGIDVTRMPAHGRARAGMSRTFQINQLFGALTPLQSVYLAMAERAGQGAAWWRRAGGGADDALVDEAAALVARFGLADVMTTPASRLPYGRQRLLEIALAVASRPQVLLLDEPAAGIPEGERSDVLAIVAELPRDVAVLLIEHDMDLVFSFAERITVLVRGAVLAEGPPQEVAADPRVRAAYLGEGAVA
jgi:ABC-type branched-subunit amino acid transport system ATPase component